MFFQISKKNEKGDLNFQRDLLLFQQCNVLPKKRALSRFVVVIIIIKFFCVKSREKTTPAHVLSTDFNAKWLKNLQKLEFKD